MVLQLCTRGYGPWPDAGAGVGPGRVLGSAGPGPVVSRDWASIGDDYPCQARVTARGASGAEVAGEGLAVQAADVSALTCGLWDLGCEPGPLPQSLTTASQVASPAVDISAAIADSLAADDLWTTGGRAIDSTGRNFLFIIAGSLIVAAHRYRAVFNLTLSDGSQVSWAHEIDGVDLTQ